MLRPERRGALRSVLTWLHIFRVLGKRAAGWGLKRQLLPFLSAVWLVPFSLPAPTLLLFPAFSFGMLLSLPCRAGRYLPSTVYVLDPHSFAFAAVS